MLIIHVRFGVATMFGEVVAFPVVIIIATLGELLLTFSILISHLAARLTVCVVCAGISYSGLDDEHIVFGSQLSSWSLSIYVFLLSTNIIHSGNSKN
jgi:hypothetical protein